MSVLKVIAPILGLAAPLALSIQAVSQESADHPAFSITVQGPQTAAKLGEPVKIDITLTNISDRALGVHLELEGRSEITYEVFMEGLRGGEAPTTAYLRAVRGQHLPSDPDGVIAYSTKIWLIQPGKSATTHMDLTKLYEIKEPGTYKVWVARKDKVSGIKVQSNALTISVSP